MFHHPFRSLDLDNLFTLEYDSSVANWQLVCKKDLPYQNNHLVNLLKVHQQELDDN